MLYGVNPVLEQIRRDPDRLQRVWIAQGAVGGAAAVAAAARRAGIVVSTTERRRLDDLAAGGAHQGVVGEVEPFRYTEIESLIAGRPAALLALDQVTDPRNLGALIRSAEAAGLGGVIVPRDRSAGITEVAAKASAGAVAFLPVAQVTNLARALKDLQVAGYWIVGLDGEAGGPLFSFTFPDPCVIVAGSEGRGLRPLTRAGCDHLVAIPMAGRVGSLNVSVAAAVALFERLRQRQDGSGRARSKKAGPPASPD